MNKKTKILSIKNVDFNENYKSILRKINLDVKEGEIHTILGLSGAGKSTLIKLVSGYQEVSSGDILFRDKKINNLSIFERNFRILDSTPYMFSHLTLKENIEIGIRKDVECIDYSIDKLMEYFDLNRIKDSKISNLSSGESYRVCFIRTIISKSPLIMLDEPLNYLDAENRSRVLYLIKDLAKKYNTTFIIVSHNIKEVVEMSDSISIIEDGTVKDSGTLSYVKANPKSRYNVNFINKHYKFSTYLYGIDSQNLTIGTVNKVLDLPLNKINIKEIDGSSHDRKIVMYINFSDILIYPYEKVGVEEQSIDKGIIFTVKRVLGSGSSYHTHIKSDDFEIKVKLILREKYNIGDKITITIKKIQMITNNEIS